MERGAERGWWVLIDLQHLSALVGGCSEVGERWLLVELVNVHGWGCEEDRWGDESALVRLLKSESPLCPLSDSTDHMPQRGRHEEIHLHILFYCRRLPTPSSQLPHDPPQPPTPSGVRTFRNNTTSAAVHPPRIAVSVKYILSLAAGVNARSAPPGIAELLNYAPLIRNACRKTWPTYGFIAIRQIV